MTATASDPDGDVLIYQWNASGGVLTDAASSIAYWLSPVAGTYEISVTATDPQNAVATAVISVVVVDSANEGSAAVEVDINSWPEVLSLLPTPSQIAVGETTSLDLTVLDQNDDTLSFSWTADCAGEFSDSTLEDPGFTLNTDNGGQDCELTVVITDSRGGSNTAKIHIATYRDNFCLMDSECDENEKCVDNVCSTSCESDCENRFCGDDGCGGSCGECPDMFLCFIEEDFSYCDWDPDIPTCEGKECGQDGWGNGCGYLEGYFCADGQLLACPFNCPEGADCQQDPALESPCDGCVSDGSTGIETLGEYCCGDARQYFGDPYMNPRCPWGIHSFYCASDELLEAQCGDGNCSDVEDCIGTCPADCGPPSEP